MCEWDLRGVAEGATDLIHVHMAQERRWGWLRSASENSFLLQSSQAVDFAAGSPSPSFGHNSSLSIKKKKCSFEAVRTLLEGSQSSLTGRKSPPV